MQPIVIIFTVALTFFSTGSYAQSTTPTCIVCPAADNIGTLNDVAGSDHKLYPAHTAGYGLFLYPNLRSSIADVVLIQVSGALVTDNDAGNCPLTTVTTCTSRRKRNALPRSPRLPRAGARAETATMMKIRQKLGAAKRRERPQMK